eukprot:3471618-Prymnesium_polylepis.1
MHALGMYPGTCQSQWRSFRSRAVAAIRVAAPCRLLPPRRPGRRAAVAQRPTAKGSARSARAPG